MNPGYKKGQRIGIRDFEGEVVETLDGIVKDYKLVRVGPRTVLLLKKVPQSS